MPNRITGYFKDYASYHNTQGNQICHSIGIPLIVISLLGLLGGLPIGPHEGLTGSLYFRLDGGTLLLTAGILWYLFLDWKLTLSFSLILIGFYFLGRTIPTPGQWFLFVVGWVFQGIGHAVYEKRSPAFFKNVTHLLTGPLWIYAKAIGHKTI